MTIERDEAAALLGETAPFAYQLRVADRLLAGQNVLLQAPTGAGKTKAALLPFLYARKRGLAFADRLIYATPMRTLVTALAEEAAPLVASADPTLRVTVQMGGQTDDPYFEGDVIFTTIDQLLSAYIGAPVSLPGRNANIVGAAPLGAYIIFDEFHLLEPDKALTTATDLAARLAPYSRVLFMSATATTGAASLIGGRAQATFEEARDDELAAMPSQRDKRRRVHYVAETLTAAHILRERPARVIAVVNTVDRAQRLYRDLRAADPHLGATLRLLHARFTREDRAAAEAWARRVFRPGSTESGILVATQVIEVGINISAQALHSDLAPAAAIFQRAGRCARFAREAGDVFVYALPEAANGAPNVAPYEASEREPIAATAAALAERSGRAFTFADERAVTEAASAVFDAARLADVPPRLRRKAVEEAMREGHPSAIRALIRDAASVSLAIHQDPNSVPPHRQLASFSISDGVWRGFTKRAFDAGQPIWALQAPARSEDGPAPPEWARITDEKQMLGAFWVCVSPQSATYDRQLGLQLGVPGVWQSPEQAPPERSFNYLNKRERYERHVALTIGQIVRQGPAHRVAARRLAAALDLEPVLLERLVQLAAALHDVAKLADGWQVAAWRWQQAVTPEAVRNEFVAHTDRDLRQPAQRALARQGVYRLPGHAAESAWAALPTIQSAIDQWLAEAPEETRFTVEAALLCAIARHHGGEMQALEDFALGAGARATAAQALASLACSDVPLQDHPSAVVRLRFGDSALTPAADPLGFLLYWHIARRLRRADQLATEEGSA